jgi:putative ABC transport system ATP-binding protein
MSERSSIDCVDVVKAYEEGRIRALNGMSLHVEPGEFVAVVGPSGCGKSTLLHLARERNLDHYRALHVGMVFQLHNLLPTLNAIENVQVPMFELGIRASERRKRASNLLGLVGLSERERNRPAQLSGGERQRVAIARALANEPEILLADEPTGSLDSEAGESVLDLLERLREERETTLVLVTHDQAVATRADRLVRMLDGRVDTTTSARDADRVPALAAS